jgi:hypothetical protein
MTRDNRRPERAFDRTAGRCHICGKRLAWSNYGTVYGRGAWEIDHSRARARGGSDHGNNLFAACVSCNRSKRDVSSRTMRHRMGRRRAPLSVAQKGQAQRQYTATGGVLGAVALGAVAGPAGLLWGAIIGAAIGSSVDPDSD